MTPQSPKTVWAPAAWMAAVFLAAGCTTAPPKGADAKAPAEPQKAAKSASAASAPVAAAAPASPGASAPATGTAPPARANAGAAPAGPPAAPGAPQPFATVIKDAKKTDGLIAVWQKDDKFWLELKPEDFDKPARLAAE